MASCLWRVDVVERNWLKNEIECIWHLQLRCVRIMDKYLKVGIVLQKSSLDLERLDLFNIEGVNGE